MLRYNKRCSFDNIVVSTALGTKEHRGRNSTWKQQASGSSAGDNSEHSLHATAQRFIKLNEGFLSYMSDLPYCLRSAGPAQTGNSIRPAINKKTTVTRATARMMRLSMIELLLLLMMEVWSRTKKKGSLPDTEAGETPCSLHSSTQATILHTRS